MIAAQQRRTHLLVVELLERRMLVASDLADLDVPVFLRLLRHFYFDVQTDP